MIVPDDKDWTWVLQRPCPDCGFDASTTATTDVAKLIEANAQAWTHLLTTGALRPGRPDASTWSSLEYACHVRDVFRRYLERIELMLNEDDPFFPNWDQDLSAVEEAYEQQDPQRVVDELREAATKLAARLSRIAEPEWPRPGRRGDGAAFTVETISRYMVHDPIHHVWDVTKRQPTTS